MLAAGKGTRMGGDTPKLYLEVKDKPVIYYPLKTFQESELIDDIILVVSKGYIEYVQKQIVDTYGFSKVSTVIEGGNERYDSVWEGIKSIEDDPERKRYIFIHDAARAFVDGDMLQRASEAVKAYGACVVGMPAKDTIKIADSQGFISQTPDRDMVWVVQTPQVFDFSIIKKAYSLLMRESYIQVTDDCMVVEQMLDYPIKLVEGSYRNIKITTPEDIIIAERLLSDKK